MQFRLLPRSHCHEGIVWGGHQDSGYKIKLEALMKNHNPSNEGVC